MVKELSFVFENTEVEMVTIDNEIMFEIYSTGMALGQIKKNAKGVLYPFKSRIDKNIENAEIKPCVRGVHTYITESQLYDLMLEMKTDKVKPFRKWIINEVIPQIRLTGGYIPIEETDDEKLILAKALQIMQRTVEEKDVIIDSMKHKADTYDDIMEAKNTFDMNAVGKMVGMGEYKLFEYLRNKKILFYNSNNDNVPYERFMKAKYFSVIDTIAPNGETHSTTRVYQKGIDYILKQLKKDKKKECRLLEVSANV